MHSAGHNPGTIAPSDGNMKDTQLGENPNSIPTSDSWNLAEHVLSLASFPGCCILRNNNRNNNGRGTCSCCPGVEKHRDFFGFCRQIVAPSMRNDKRIPEVKVCWNAENLFECRLNRDLVGRNDRPYFKDLKTIREAQRVLYKGTFWFPRLFGNKPSCTNRKEGVALLRLLANLSTYSGPESIEQLYRMKLHKGAVNRLRSILANIDGLLMQLVLCFPDRETYLTWERLDQIVHCMLCNYLPDYFGSRDLLDKSSTFEKVKLLRKEVKEQGFNPVGDLRSIDVPREMSFFEGVNSFIKNGKRPIDIFRVATLCQTRASGVPPKSMYLKAMLKIKGILTDPEDPSVYERVADYIRPAVLSIHSKVLDRLGSESKIEKFWSNCLEKAKISLSDSGEFFTNSESGGKLEAARRVLSSRKTTKIYNLFTGVVENEVDTHSIGQGEALFHWALEMFSDREHCYERNLMSVRISLVAELGKYRAITVSHLAHAVLLHVLSHVLLEYLRAVPSSESGVKAANHAWNFFKRLSHKNPNANFLFGDKQAYLFSTDWEQSTDYCDQSVAQSILNNLCHTMGIPQWYRETCVFALCAPRQVETMRDDNVLECFYTTRGELMGDPVTKVVLHYYHLVARETALMQLSQISSVLKADEGHYESFTPQTPVMGFKPW